MIQPDCVTSPSGKGRSGSGVHVSVVVHMQKAICCTVSGHDGCEDGLELVDCHYAVCEETLKHDAVHIVVRFFVW